MIRKRTLSATDANTRGCLGSLLLQAPKQSPDLFVPAPENSRPSLMNLMVWGKFA
jgi:hypothetical protein